MIEILLKPLVPTLKTYLKDDWSFLKKLSTKIPFDSTIYSCHTLYTLIPTELGIEAISYWLYKKQELIPQRFTYDFIIKSLNFVLKSNNVFLVTCTFNYLEQQGEQNMLPPPPLVCLAKCWLFGRDKTPTNELLKYFNDSECKLIMELLKRYMDHVFIFWPLKLNFKNFKRV